MILQNSTDIKTEIFYNKQGDIAPIDVRYEKHTINPNGLVQLQNIPSLHTVFAIKGKNGITVTTYNKAEVVASQYDFTVDYVNGILTFHNSQVGKEIQVSYTNAIGRLSLSADRIFTNLDQQGNVVQTLNTLIEKGQSVLSKLDTVGGATKIIDEMRGYIDSIKSLRPQINEGYNTSLKLKRDIDIAKLEKANLVNETAKASGQIDEMNSWVENNGNIVNLNNRVTTTEGKLNTVNAQLEQIDDKSSQALAKAENPVGALREAGFKFEKQDLSESLLSEIQQANITISKGLLNNKGVDYPLKAVTRNSEITVISDVLKNAILDVKVIGAKQNKYYRIQYIGNGTTAWGEPYYGIVVHEYDKNTFSSNSESEKKTIISRPGNYKDKPSGIVSWVFKNESESISINITIDFSVLTRDRYDLDNKTIGYSAIIDESCYIYVDSRMGDLNINRSIEYPFKNILRDGVLKSEISSDLKDAILDVKIINAKPNKQYKIDWIGNGTTSWGKPEYAIYLQEMDPGFQNINQIFNRQNAHLDAPEENIVTRVITNAETDIVLSITIDYSKLKLERYTMNSDGNMGYGSIIDESCYIVNKTRELINSEEYNTKMLLSKEGDTYLIRSPYNNEKNIVWKFSSLGINEIIHLTAIYFQPISANEFEGLELFQSISTDWISPYNFSAKNNTVNNSTITTGGNHGTSSGAGFRTAYPEFKKCYIKNKEVIEDGIYSNLDSIILEAKTNIASSNVINLETGEGFRGVITEFITYTITPKTIKAIISILCNEDVVFRTYAGPQISTLGNPYKNISFGGDLNPTIIMEFPNTYITGTKVEGAKVDRFICEHDNGYVVAYKDKNCGINDLRYLDDNTGIGQISGSKAYMKNFENKPTDFNQGDNFYYNCIYSFNKKYECEGSMRAYRVDDIYMVDFDKSVSNTFFKIDKEDINKKVEVIDSSNVNIDNYSSSLGVRLTATDKGWIKFKLI